MGPLLILLCTVIWGTAFLAQKTGAEHYGPFTLTCYRNILAGFFIFAIVAVRDRFRRPACRGRGGWRVEVVGGTISGAVLFASMATQQIGIEHTTPGISAFLTANYILLVPVFSWIVGRGRPGWPIWLGVALAIAGTYLISVSPSNLGSLDFSKLPVGELWTLLCAALFAVQIMVVDRFAPRCDVMRFSMVQMFVAGLCSAPFMLLPSEASRITFAHFRAGLFSLFYVGVMSSGIAYPMQNLGQALTPATLASILMSFEAVVGLVSGWLVLGDSLTVRQLAGCAFVFSAVVLAQALSSRPSGGRASPRAAA